jgi:hypothetical protein
MTLRMTSIGTGVGQGSGQVAFEGVRDLSTPGRGAHAADDLRGHLERCVGLIKQKPPVRYSYPAMESVGGIALALIVAVDTDGELLAVRTGFACAYRVVWSSYV